MHYRNGVLSAFLLYCILFLITGCTEKGEPAMHPGDWKVPGSDNFHGLVLRTNGWGFHRCQACHGDNFLGGTSEVSCSSCHTGGVGSCTTCHGDRDKGYPYPPLDLLDRNDKTVVTVGAHAAHMESELAAVSCGECHAVPTDFLDTLHLEFPIDNIAEVTFGSTATFEGEVEPVWNRNDAACSLTYCHGNFTYGSVSGNDLTTVWTSPGSVLCGSCHGIPPTGHIGSYKLEQCSLCHSSVVNSDGQIIDKSKHVNGEKNLN